MPSVKGSGGGAKASRAEAKPETDTSVGTGTDIVFWSDLTPRGRKRNANREVDYLLRIIGNAEDRGSRYPLKVFGGNPMKEIIETAYATYATGFALRTLHNPLHVWNASFPFYDNPRILFVVPGDGINPRTAIGLASIYKGDVLSIDPDMGNTGPTPPPPEAVGRDGNITKYVQKKYKLNYPNLHCFRNKILADGDGDKFDIDSYAARQGTDYDFVVLVAVHAHCSTQVFFDKFKNILAFVMPCCFKSEQYLERELHNEHLLFSGKIRQRSYSGPGDFVVYKRGTIVQHEPKPKSSSVKIPQKRKAL